MTDLEQSLVSTLAFFDAFDRPLSREELFRLLWGCYGYSDDPDLRITYPSFLLQLATLRSASIGYTDGFYCLSGREEIIPNHQLRVRLIEEKTAIARRAIKKMRWIPFVRAVFLCNTVALGCPKDTSDVDVFIVVKDERLWLTRLLVTLTMSLLRLRRTKQSVADRVCLSFYATERALDLGKIRLYPDDIYLAYWLAHLVPLFDPNNVLKTIAERNAWTREYLPHAALDKQLTEQRSVGNPVLVRLFRRTGERILSGGIGRGLETLAKRLQQFKMQHNTASLQNEPDTRVIISDDMLKFHENDRRGYYREEWKKKCQLFV